MPRANAKMTSQHRLLFVLFALPSVHAQGSQPPPPSPPPSPPPPSPPALSGTCSNVSRSGGGNSYHSWCPVSSELLAVSGSFISFSMEWKDQGGDTHTSNIRLFRGSTVLWTTPKVASKNWIERSWVIPLGSGGTSVEFKHSTGQPDAGNSQEIHIRNFQWTWVPPLPPSPCHANFSSAQRAPKTYCTNLPASDYFCSLYYIVRNNGAPCEFEPKVPGRCTRFVSAHRLDWMRGGQARKSGFARSKKTLTLSIAGTAMNFPASPRPRLRPPRRRPRPRRRRPRRRPARRRARPPATVTACTTIST